MEDLIKDFLKTQLIISGSGSGDGYGSGSGDGDGDGSGDGSGSGDGDGYGYGYGDGDGSGSGYGSGYGDGYGDGSGSGDGDGYGYGYDLHTIISPKNHISEYRKGFLTKEIHSLKTFKGKLVYYIDDIPCCFLSIIGNMAKVDVIKDDFTTETQYIAKQGDLFAHGKTKEEALEDVSNKFYASLSFEEKKAEFISKFKKSDTHKVQVFFDWHGVLTGSCRSGRIGFAQSRGLSLENDMTVLEFLELTKDNYNGEIIKGILADIE